MTLKCEECKIFFPHLKAYEYHMKTKHGKKK